MRLDFIGNHESLPVGCGFSAGASETVCLLQILNSMRYFFKAAITYFYINNGSQYYLNVKGITHREEPTEVLGHKKKVQCTIPICTNI